MKKQGLLVGSLIIVLCFVLAGAAADVAIHDCPPDKTIYINWLPFEETAPFPTVTWDEESVTISGVAAWGVMPVAMTYWSEWMGGSSLGPDTLSNTENPVMFEDKMVLNASPERLRNGEVSPSFNWTALQLYDPSFSSFRMDLDWPYDRSKENQSLQDMLYLGISPSENGMYHCWTDLYQFNYGYNNGAGISANYGWDGQLINATVEIDDMMYRIERLNASVPEYALTSVYTNDKVWYIQRNAWFGRFSGGQEVDAPEGIDPEVLPVELIGDYRLISPIEYAIRYNSMVFENELFLPEDLKVIESMAFLGTEAEVVYIPANVEEIANDAFDDKTILIFRNDKLEAWAKQYHRRYAIVP